MKEILPQSISINPRWSSGSIADAADQSHGTVYRVSGSFEIIMYGDLLLKPIKSLRGARIGK